MVVAELQRLVDYVGGRLERSVAIDDPHIRLLAYTAHTGEVDSARVDSVMNRGVSAEVSSYVAAQGAESADDLFTVPANPAIGVRVERIGMPIRHEGHLLGYLWVVSSDGPVTEDHATALRDAAARAALILHGEYLTGVVTRGRERELVRDLLSPDARLRAEAAEVLIEEDLAVAGQVTGLVVTVTHDPGEPLTEPDRLALRIATDAGRRRLPLRQAFDLSRPDHALLLTIWPGTSNAVATKEIGELATVVQERVVRELGPAGAGRCWVGVGGVQRGLAHAHQTYGEAHRAAEVARVTGALGAIVPHDQLGVYALLAKLAPDELAAGVHPSIRRLLDPAAGGHDLVETLETYLDNAGDVQRTATQLHIHRATLYYRLRRIEEIGAIDLDRGEERLAVHLGLKLIRMVPPGTAAG